MPTYLYKNEETKEIIEVIQRMNEEHVYFDEDGLEWKRVWTAPQASIDTQLDPFSQNSFIEKTKGKGTVGDLIDRGEEWSEKRKKIRGDGRDPIKQRGFDDYAKARNGKKHLDDPTRKSSRKKI